MSRRFYLIEEPRHRSFLQVLSEFFQVENEGCKPGPRFMEMERRKLDTAEALMNSNPELKTFPLDITRHFNKIKIRRNPDEPPPREIELYGPFPGNSVHISLYDAGAMVTVPWRHNHEEALMCLYEAWDYMRIIQEVTRFVIYDPQLGMVVDIETDFDEIFDSYAPGVKEYVSYGPPTMQDDSPRPVRNTEQKVSATDFNTSGAGIA